MWNNYYFVPVNLTKLPSHTMSDNPPNRVNFRKGLSEKVVWIKYFISPAGNGAEQQRLTDQCKYRNEKFSCRGKKNHPVQGIVGQGAGE